MTQLVCVPPDIADRVWPAAESFIDKAMRRNELDPPEFVKAEVLSGRALLWVLWDEKTKEVTSAAVTQINELNGNGRHCTLLAFGGDLKDALPYLEKIEDYAHAQQCKSLRFVGPRAWLKILPGDYFEHAAVMEKVL